MVNQRIYFGIGLLLAVFIIWYGVQTVLMAKPLAKAIKTEVIDIKSGTSSWVVAKALKNKSLTRSAIHFFIYQKLTGAELVAGIYYLSPSQTPREIFRTIAKGKVSEYRITIPEGWRAEQIGQLLEQKEIISASSFSEAAKAKEGRLFPDTYRFRVGILPSEIVDKMTANFTKRIEGLKLTDEQLVIASIVEREAKHDEDRPKMAGVYFNRLKIGMVLEADPTVQYALDTERLKSLTAQKLKEFKFWSAPTAEQNKNFESAYNTYRRKGLPPGPICNPGLASIKGAINPEKHDYFFFFNLADGTTIYSTTRDQHDANRAKYGV